MQKFLENIKADVDLRLLAPESTKTSLSAAQVLGCSVAEIAKTICLFHSESSAFRSPVLVTLSGDKRVNLEKLARHIHVTLGSLRKMNADEVKMSTGYSIGGVPPFPHDSSVKVFSVESLFRFDKVWAAAGRSNAVMRLSPSLLIVIGNSKIDISE